MGYLLFTAWACCHVDSRRRSWNLGKSVSTPRRDADQWRVEALVRPRNDFRRILIWEFAISSTRLFWQTSDKCCDIYSDAKQQPLPWTSQHQWHRLHNCSFQREKRPQFRIPIPTYRQLTRYCVRNFWPASTNPWERLPCYLSIKSRQRRWLHRDLPVVTATFDSRL